MLKIHFFTIVLNGEPFIRHHAEVFRQLSVPWHWHVVEGVAAHRHDTAWGAKRGGNIPAEFRQTTLSHDGTTAYLDSLQSRFPQQISLYRKEPPAHWDGKLEMVRAPLSNIREPCLLWQVDADELWTVEQIETTQRLFLEQPEKTTARFACHFFFGPEICTSRWGVFGNFTHYEWLRIWRFQPGDVWASHEPPQLGRKTPDGTEVDLDSLHPFTHAETAQAGLVFQHFAYATEAQVRFKENYYGYPGGLAAWKKLQSLNPAAIRLRNVLDWVWEAEIGRAHTFRTFYRWLLSPFSAASVASPARARGTMPLAQRNVLGEWRFFAHSPPAKAVLTLLLVRADQIGDHLLASSLLPALRRAYPYACLVVVCPEDVRELHDHRGEVDEVMTFDRAKGHRSAAYRRELFRRLRSYQADLVISTQYTRDKLSGLLVLHSGAREKVGFHAEPRGLKPRRWRRFQAAFDQVIPAGPEQSHGELGKYSLLLSGLGISEPLAPPTCPTSPSDDEFARQTLGQHGLAKKNCVALFVGSAQSEKVFRGYGAALKEALPSGWAVLALGAQADWGPAAQELASLPSPTVNLCGRSTLRQAAALLRHCRLAVGPDTGLAHLACAVGCPQVVVMGGGDFGRFFPYCAATSVVCLPLDCYQCQWRCRYSSALCIHRIHPAVLAEAVRTTLASSTGRPRLFLQKDLNEQPLLGAHQQPHWQMPQRLQHDWELIIV